MASGSFNISTSNQYISGYVSWSESNQNITNNTTDVTATMYLHRTNTGYTSSGTDTFHVSINGTDHANTLAYSLTNSGYTQMVTGTTTVTHNSDGTKSITIGWSGGGGGGGVFTVTASSGTATLMTIPRASTVSSSISWTAGTQNLPITLNVADSSFHHSIQVFVGDTSSPVVYGSAIGQRDNIGSSTTWVFTQAENTTTYQKINGYENRPVIVRVFTYDSGGNQIGGYQDATGTVYAVATANATIGTGNSFNISDLPTLTYSLNNYTTGNTGGFTYNLIFTLGSFTKTFTGLTAQTGTIGFTSADVTAMYNATPNSNTLTGTVDVRTNYNGVSTEDGIPATHTTNITANVTGSNPTFGTGYTYTDSNSVTSAITGDASYIIQNNSTVQVTLPTTAFATAVNGATMTGTNAKYTFVLNGVTKTATQGGSNIVLSFGTVNASTNQTLTVTATDSRGNSATTSMTVKMLPYQAPIVTTTASRVNGFETTIHLDLSGSISSLTTTVQKNALTSISGEPAPLEYCYAENVTGSTFSAWSAFTYTTTGATYQATEVSIDLDNTKSYIFQVRATDKLQTSTQTITVASGQPILFMDFDLNSVGVGKFPTGTGTLETQGDTIVGGNLTATNGTFSGKVTGQIDLTGTTGNVNGNAGYWVKLGTVTITQQFNDVTNVIQISSVGNANGWLTGARITWKIKQQAVMGSSPAVNVFIENRYTLIAPDITSITTVNTTAQTVCELWIKVKNSYDQFNFTVIQNSQPANGMTVWTKNFTPVASHSSGTVVTGIYSDPLFNSVEVGYGLSSASPSTKAGLIDFHSSGGGFNGAIDYDSRIIGWNGDPANTGKGNLTFIANDFTFNGKINTLSEANFALQNGWVDYGNGYDNSRYVKFANGLVVVKGLICAGSIGYVCAVLPAGCRPWARRIFITRCDTGYTRLDVENNGNISIQSGSNGWTSINICFYAEA